ncbi:acyl-CoA dehydrogenase family protein [Actinocorallia longicatena]|uniref:Acyl-CoA dehydrogenase family protein n=1 Tax=Actinocorallia longicatena TaxID=111803 RepID=A0ABP6QF75_9ACTN
MSDLLYDETETELRGAVREFLDDRAPWQAVLEWTELDEPHDTSLWNGLTGMDVAALAIPEKLGGAGASWRETAVVLEELGRSVAPVPFLTSSVLATAALLAADDHAYLRDLATGTLTAALAIPFTTAPGVVFRNTVTNDGDRLSGTVTSVAHGLSADLLLVPTVEGLFAVGGGDVDRTAVISLDRTRPLADLSFDRAPARRVAVGDLPLDHALSVGAGLLASEQLGIAERCLDMTIAYVKTRYQFGRPVGSYQALKHRLADLWASVGQARAVARHAADCLATDDPDVPVAVAVAQAHCSAVALKAAEECVQLHGGIGFTWEHPAHLLLKRAKSASLALGSPSSHRSVLAELVELPL